MVFKKSPERPRTSTDLATRLSTWSVVERRSLPSPAARVERPGFPSTRLLPAPLPAAAIGGPLAALAGAGPVQHTLLRADRGDLVAPLPAHGAGDVAVAALGVRLGGPAQRVAGSGLGVDRVAAGGRVGERTPGKRPPLASRDGHGASVPTRGDRRTSATVPSDARPA